MDTKVATEKALGTIRFRQSKMPFFIQFYRQIACADLLLLNKVDRVDDSSVAIIEDIIHSINPSTDIRRTIRGELPPDIILNLNAYSSASTLMNSKFPLEIHGPGDSHDSDGHDHHSSLQRSGITSLKIEIPVIQSALTGRFDEWIRFLLWENGLPGKPDLKVEVLRCKGLFCTTEGHYFMLQGVRNLYEIKQLSDEETMGLTDGGKLVLIGRGLAASTRENFYEFMGLSESQVV